MFAPGTLREKLTQVTDAALQSGALQPIPTETNFVEDGGIRFLVRVVSNLARKDQLRRAAGERPAGPCNPFLPYDPAMLVADASDTHVCLLNKFNVLEHHLLIVTRRFEPQEAPLNLQDFTALWTCLAESDSLGFYNAGAEAGASQPHKHLQWVPLPLAGGGPRVPIEPLIDAAAVRPGTVGRTTEFPFAHALARFEPRLAESPQAAARSTLTLYQAMLGELHLLRDSGPSPVTTAPHNLLITQHWMLAVPRSRERVDSLSLNALAFAGALLVRNHQQLAFLRDFGLLAALRQVALSRDASPPASRPA